MQERAWGGTRIDVKGSPFEQEMSLWGVRWDVAYPLSYRQLEEMRQERGVSVDPAPLDRWGLKEALALAKQFGPHERPGGPSWRLDEASIRIKGQGQYWYRAVAKAGQTVDCLLTAPRHRAAARRFLRQAIGTPGLPAKITSAKSGANQAAIESDNTEPEPPLEIRPSKSLTNIID